MWHLPIAFTKCGGLFNCNKFASNEHSVLIVKNSNDYTRRTFQNILPLDVNTRIQYTHRGQGNKRVGKNAFIHLNPYPSQFPAHFI